MLNPEVMPKLRVHDIYANVLRNHRGWQRRASYAALQQRLQEARWFIKNIQQRFDTILRVSTAIVERQKGFFTHGEMAMRPLVLREIADELGLHESTISRVTTAKYMATPFGTFELKYFFGSGLGTESGGNASSTAVRALIKQFISAESDKKAFERQPDFRDAERAGHRMRPPHRGQIPRGAEDRPRREEGSCELAGQTEAQTYVNQLQLFFPCAAGVEDYLAPRCTTSPA
jgi:AraC-like DNA-binding protein